MPCRSWTSDPDPMPGQVLTGLSTTRDRGKVAALKSIGVDHVVIDDGRIAEQVRGIVPDGVDAAVELVGTPTLRDTLVATHP